MLALPSLIVWRELNSISERILLPISFHYNFFVLKVLYLFIMLLVTNWILFLFLYISYKILHNGHFCNFTSYISHINKHHHALSSEHKTIENWEKGASVKVISYGKEVFNKYRRMSYEVALAVDVSRWHAHI